MATRNSSPLWKPASARSMPKHWISMPIRHTFKSLLFPLINWTSKVDRIWHVSERVAVLLELNRLVIHWISSLAFISSTTNNTCSFSKVDKRRRSMWSTRHCPNPKDKVTRGQRRSFSRVPSLRRCRDSLRFVDSLWWTTLREIRSGFDPCETLSDIT